MYATNEKTESILARVQDRTELSALHIAVQRGKGDVADLLLQRGADPNDDTPGWAPLHWATGTFKTEMDGANGIRAPRDHEWGALHGVSIGKFELVKTLLDHGADPNARLKRSPSRHGFTAHAVATGITPLGLAAFAGEGDIIRLLVDRGADMSIKSDSSRTPLLFATGIYRRRAEKAVSNEALMTAVVALVELGAKATESDAGKTTALHGAAWLRSTEMVQYLVDHGADVYAKNSRGHTPLDIADHSGISFGEDNADQERLPVGHLLYELSVPNAVKRSLKEWGALSPDLRETIESILQDESEKLEKERLEQLELEERRRKERIERKRKEELANKESQDLR
jgi:ankyrin repeat protein